MRRLTALFAVFLVRAATAQTFTWDGGLSHGNITVNDNWTRPTTGSAGRRRSPA